MPQENGIEEGGRYAYLWTFSVIAAGNGLLLSRTRAARRAG
jgi:hypothetical protein